MRISIFVISAVGKLYKWKEIAVSHEIKNSWFLCQLFSFISAWYNKKIETHNDTTFLGKCNFRGNERVFGIRTKDRRQHLYVIGKTGTGKTTLLENMVLQDIRAGRGVGIIDPHGEFVDQHVLPQIPTERINDVVYFNPVDAEYPIGFNVLEVPDPRYKHLIVSNLLGIFTKIWANVWSARMEYILQNCILALIDTPGTTLLGIPRILVDKQYREKIVANVKDPVVKSFWIHEYETWRDQFRNEAIVPIQNKVGQFLNTGFIRNIVGQAKSTLNISELMNNGKILLVNVSKGKVGEDNSALLGAMIITTIQLAAMERVRIPEEDRQDFYLYVDEFQNFATDSFASILSEARKYRLNLIIAHQYIGQLVTDVSTKVRDAVFGNVGTMISFRVGAADAEYLETEFTPEFVQADLIGLPNHHIYLKLMVDGVTSRPFSGVTLPPLKFEVDPSVKEKVITASREHYGRPIEEVEAEIMSWTGMGGIDGGGGTAVGPSTMHEAVCWNCGKTTTVPFKPDGKRPVYCLNCLKQIEEGKLIPLPERMPQVGRARFSETLGDIGIEFSAPRGESRPLRREMETRQMRPESRSGRPHIPRGDRPPQPQRIQTEERFAGGRLPERVGREERRQTQSFARPPQRSESPHEVPRPGLRSRPAVRTPEKARPLSLADLASKETKTAKDAMGIKEIKDTRELKRPSIDVPGLRKVLDQALAANKKDVHKERLQENKSSTEKEIDGQVVKPGETIRFD